jgi:hypothetical protein
LLTTGAGILIGVEIGSATGAIGASELEVIGCVGGADSLIVGETTGKIGSSVALDNIGIGVSFCTVPAFWRIN